MFQSEVQDLESKVDYLGNPLGRMPESERKKSARISEERRESSILRRFETSSSLRLTVGNS